MTNARGPAIATDRLYHYFFRPEELETALDDILANGLLPLSARPDSERWKLIQQYRPGFYELLYEGFARPIVGRPYSNSGVFLTPIDFRRMIGLSAEADRMATLPRLAVPLAAIDLATAAAGYVDLDDQPHPYPLNEDTLRQLAAEWPAERIASLYGRDRSKMFYHVPQVAVYQDDGVKVKAEWLERPQS
ncbi:MAG: hypothetical protein ACYC6V_06025 [Bacillota bacterium]